jgi:tetratricopeptide (TPR) repeat protein
LLETVRAFAMESLGETGELEDAHRVHAAHFARVADPLDWRLTWKTREHVRRGNRLFELEWDNFRGALAWATSTPGRFEPEVRSTLGLALMARLWGLWCDFDLAESRHWIEAVLDVNHTNESSDFGACLYAYAVVLTQQGEPSKARLVAQRSVAILQKLDTREMAYALLYLGETEAALGEVHASRRACQEALGLARDLGDGFLLGKALDNLGFLAWDEENWAAALQLFQAAHEAYLRGGWEYLPIAEHRIACVRRKLGQVNEAHQLMSAGFRHEARTYRPKFLLIMAEDYAAALADAGFAAFTPLVLGACDAARHRIGLHPDQREERVIADARRAAETAVTASDWTDAYARGQNMTVLEGLAEAVASTTDLRI